MAVGVRAPSEFGSAPDSYSWRRRERPEGLSGAVRGVCGGETWDEALEDKDGEEEGEGATEAKVT